jgi:hypothetical protein
MQLKTQKPAHCGFAYLGDAVKDSMAMDTLGMTDFKSGTVNKRNACGVIYAISLQIDKQRDYCPWYQIHKAVVTDQIGKITAVMGKEVLIEIFERAIAAGLEGNKNSHDLAGT